MKIVHTSDWHAGRVWKGINRLPELADDLRSEHFQAYLLEEAFRELVRGASERLIKLSGRYVLEYRNDSFHVLDNDNAGQRRSADGSRLISTFDD